MSTDTSQNFQEYLLSLDNVNMLIDITNTILESIISNDNYCINEELESFLFNIMKSNNVSNNNKYIYFISFLNNYYLKLKQYSPKQNIIIKEYLNNNAIFDYIELYLKNIYDNIYDYEIANLIDDVLMPMRVCNNYDKIIFNDLTINSYFNINKYCIEKCDSFYLLNDSMLCLKLLFMNSNNNFKQYENEIFDLVINVKEPTSLIDSHIAVNFYEDLVISGISLDKKNMQQIPDILGIDKIKQNKKWLVCLPIDNKCIDYALKIDSPNVALNPFLTEQQQYEIFKSNKKYFIKNLSKRKDLSEKMANKIYNYANRKNVLEDKFYQEDLIVNLYNNTNYKSLKLKIFINYSDLTKYANY